MTSPYEPVPGSLTASRITGLPGGAVAEVVINEKTAAYGRLYSGGSWSAWRLISTGVRDASLTATDGGEGPAALVSLVVMTPPPLGAILAQHLLYQRMFRRLDASGVTAADLQPEPPGRSTEGTNG